MTIDSGLMVGPGTAVEATPQMGVDYVGAQKSMYSLADAGFKYDGKKTEHDDEAATKQYTQQGGDLLTQEGLERAKTELGPKLSPKGQQKLQQVHVDWAQNQTTIIDNLAKQDEGKIKVFNGKLQMGMQVLEPLVTQYNQDLKDNEGLGSQAAKQKAAENYKARAQATAQMMKQQGVPQEMIDQLVNSSPEVASTRLHQVPYFQKMLEEQAKIRKLNADAGRAEAIATKPQGLAAEDVALEDAHDKGDISDEMYQAELEKRKGGRGGQPADVKTIQWAQGILKDPNASEEDKTTAKNLITKKTTPTGSGAGALTEPEQEALNKASGLGKIDMTKINSRNAKIYAKILMANPDVDMAAISADINLIRNPALRQKMMNAEVLPEVMENMVNAGKKVDLSHLKVAAQLEAWGKGQLNDPDWVEYLTQRNDALMMIASTMRGVGMTDQAHRVEIEAASPTMDGPALDGWLHGQMQSLQPRLREYHKIESREGAVNDHSKGAAGAKAPPQALEFLKNHPETKDKFKAKYGYLPEGM